MCIRDRDIQEQTEVIVKEEEHTLQEERHVEKGEEVKEETITTVVEEIVEAQVTVPDEKAGDEVEAELTMTEKPAEEPKVEEPATEEETEEEKEDEEEEEEEEEEEVEAETAMEVEKKPAEKPMEESVQEKTVTEPEKPVAVKKQLFLEGVKVEEEQFEKVIQEVSEEVTTDEKVETKKIPRGFGQITVTELTSDSLTLNWEEPKDIGGAKIIHYLIVMRESDKTKYKKIGEVDGDTFSYTLTKIKEDHEYSFRVYAQNEVGISTEAAEVAAAVKVPKRKKEKKEKAPEPKPTPETVEEKDEIQVVVDIQEQTEETVKEEKRIVKEVITSTLHFVLIVFLVVPLTRCEVRLK